MLGALLKSISLMPLSFFYLTESVPTKSLILKFQPQMVVCQSAISLLRCINLFKGRLQCLVFVEKINLIVIQIFIFKNQTRQTQNYLHHIQSDRFFHTHNQEKGQQI